ncbi:hypothetical protein [Pseudomonas sp. UM16]|uniref:hypothetical protein n=1 Tax=Pseudomonas sp. UM16 TaxID=3158962 RepID=UPI0039903872
MNIVEFSIFVLFGVTFALLFKRYPIKPRLIPWGIFFSFVYNALMIAFYLDVVENKKLLFFQFAPSIVEYHPTITILSMTMVIFHWRAVRTKT